MTAEQLLVWGAGGHARVVADAVRAQGRFQIAGFLDDINPGRWGMEFCGGRILGGGDLLAELLEAGVAYAVIAFGDCVGRLNAAQLARRAGLEMATVVHPRSVVANDAILGPGTVVLAGAVINCGSVLGEAVIVNTSAAVDHDCTIADGAHIGPGARLGGGVRVGRATLIGMGATVLAGVMVGEGSVVGAGAVVVKDLPMNVVAYGVPAQVRRANKES